MTKNMMHAVTATIDFGPGKKTCQAQQDRPYHEGKFEGSRMTPFIFPAAVAVLLFGGWVVLASFEPCLLQRTDPKFDCWGSILFAASFAGIGSALTGLVALLTRVILHPYLLFETQKSEWVAGLLASLILVIVSYCVIHWEINFGNIGIQLFGWLGVSLVVCGISLMVVKRIAMGGAR